MNRVVVFVDDMLVTGKMKEELVATLDKVLCRMREGLNLRKDKCVFLSLSVVYLGHRNDSQGIHPVADKLRTVQMPSPQNVSDLKIILGTPDILYAKFLPNP